MKLAKIGAIALVFSMLIGGAAAFPHDDTYYYDELDSAITLDTDAQINFSGDSGTTDVTVKLYNDSNREDKVSEQTFSDYDFSTNNLKSLDYDGDIQSFEVHRADQNTVDTVEFDTDGDDTTEQTYSSLESATYDAFSSIVGVIIAVIPIFVVLMVLKEFKSGMRRQ